MLDVTIRADEAAFLQGGGELGQLIRSYDWKSTPLGCPDTWPQSLRSALSICLHSSFPTAIYWGPELDRVFQTGEPYVGRAAPITLQRGPDNSPEERLVDFVYQPLTDAAGDRSGVFVQVTDVTDVTRAEAALRASEAKSQAIVNAIDQMIWATRADGYHDYFNDRWYEFTGVPQGSTDGEGWNGLFHPDDRELAREVWRHSLTTGEPYHIEYRLRHRSGQYRWVIGRAQCVRDEKGQIPHSYRTEGKDPCKALVVTVG